MTLGSIIGILLLPLAILWLLPLGSAVLVRLAPPRVPRPLSHEPARLCILVPAHDEALLIGPCLASVGRMRQEQARVQTLVVADNCSDDTAARARALGAKVLERDEPADRGKPAAIAWAIGQVDTGLLDALVILDADSVVDRGFADALAARGPLRDRALQARFGVANPGETWLTRLASLFVEVRYDGQFARKQRAGLNAVLTGNGMCFGVDWLSRVGWDDQALTEDLALYARATAQGEVIEYAGDARLFAQEARDLAEGSTQRRRWQAGRRAVLGRMARPVVASRAIGRLQKLDTLTELALPGPVVHGGVAVVAIAALCALGGPVALGTAALFVLALLPWGLGVVAAWSQRQDKALLALAFLRLPFYGVWRIALAIAGRLGRSETQWVRSPRHRAEGTGAGLDRDT